MKKLIKRLLIFIIANFSLVVALAQNPGDNPDARPQDPQDVPLVGNLVWLLVLAGVVVCFIVIRHQQKKSNVSK